MRTQAMRTAEQVRPVANTAREAAAHRIEDARIWAAPRLDRAAHSVEEQIAPKVSAFLSQAAERIDPSPTVNRRGRWSTFALLAGFTACAVGVVLYRNNARQWADSMKDSAADASRWSAGRPENSVNTGGAGETGTKADETSPRTY
ncbi:DUF5324 family protein [Sphaerisporangium sp. TRM90804]|uniref:DUF5324 family protein n=1 Tax=Sphaerisporangium sp. TRM90804 TaxID=3031113 RepID=UPI002449C4A7|nr:DUF5324 family protein [Sphaerisporangium sp. TRM90804]MDH2425672.1 DUF5324 family protein [Sphaerisporangium sp. TRM90804]